MISTVKPSADIKYSYAWVFYQSVKTIKFYQLTNQNRRKKDKNIQLELLYSKGLRTF